MAKAFAQKVEQSWLQVHEVRYDKQGAYHSSAKVMDLKVRKCYEQYYTLQADCLITFCSCIS